MEQRKLNKQISLIYGAVCLGMAILLCLTLSLSVGDAYGRYCKTITGRMGYSVGLKSRVWVMGQRDANQIGSALPVNWTQVGDTTYVRSVKLCVSNSDEYGTNSAIEDMKIRIRLYLPEDVYRNAMQLSMQIEGDSQNYTAIAEYLAPGAAAAQEMNASGWVYTFFDASGNELTKLLKGGRVSDLNLTITATEVPEEPKDYRLLVDIIHEDISLFSVEQEVNQ